jgi:hypothetical protein
MALQSNADLRLLNGLLPVISQTIWLFRGHILGFVTVDFFRGGVVSPTPNPQPGGSGFHIYIPWRLGGPVIPPGTEYPVMKRKIPRPRRESNPRTPIVQPVAYSLYRLSYPGSVTHMEEIKTVYTPYVILLRYKNKITWSGKATCKVVWPMLTKCLLENLQGRDHLTDLQM